VPVFVEYAGIVAAISLLSATLTGAFGNNVAAVFASGSAGVAAASKAARKQGVAPAGAKAAYRRAPYRKPALKYLYALGWVGGKKNLTQCGLTLLAPGAMTVRSAAGALVKGVVSACD
jgi:hypothetical protein